MEHQLSIFDDNIKLRLRRMRIELARVSIDKYVQTNDSGHLESALRELRKIKSHTS